MSVLCSGWGKGGDWSHDLCTMCCIVVYQSFLLLREKKKKEGDALNALAARQKWRKDTTTTTTWSMKVHWPKYLTPGVESSPWKRNVQEDQVNRKRKKKGGRTCVQFVRAMNVKLERVPHRKGARKNQRTVFQPFANAKVSGPGHSRSLAYIGPGRSSSCGLLKL